ncbi:hypothetical protein ACFIJ5_15140 [Haloimpatiens sp. FM7330]|uniref:hypothetical protein n=1 Tax=Haloimpatiens sp. FM7330 TaxID=3298610 RepID=UPI00362B7438
MNNKSILKKIISLVIVISMVNSFTVYAKTPVVKDESVYTILNQEGKVKNKIVSDWLHANSKISQINDKSILKDIHNVKGEETPQIKGNNVIWKTNKKDIFYQGNTSKELPLQVSIKYELNGKKIKPQELAGKSGKIKVNIDFINKSFKNVKVNGKNRKVYTPFATVTVVNLPINKFKNVKINNGEIVCDGNNQIVTAVTMPGLKESLSVSSKVNDLIDLNDGLEITSDVNNFEMRSIMVTATPKLPEIKELKGVKKLDELVDGISNLKKSSGKLVSGSENLKKGSEKLKEGLNEAASKVKKLEEDISKNKEKTDLIKYDNKVSLERKLMEDAFFAKDLDTSMLDMAAVFSDEKNKKLLEKTMKDYKELHLNTIMKLPSMKNVASEDNVEKISKLVDDTYDISKIDKEKLNDVVNILSESDVIIKLAKDTQKLYDNIDVEKFNSIMKLSKQEDSISRIIECANKLDKSIKSKKLKPLVELSENKEKLDLFLKSSKELSEMNLDKIKDNVDKQNLSALNFIESTSFLDDSKQLNSLKDSINKNTQLTKQEKEKLEMLIEVSNDSRNSMKNTTSAMNTMKSNIEKIDSLKKDLNSASVLFNEIDDSMEYVNNTIIPTNNELLEELTNIKPVLNDVSKDVDYIKSLSSEFNKVDSQFKNNKLLIQTLQKNSISETEVYMKEITPVFISMKDDVDENKKILKSAKVVLQVSKLSGGFEKYMDKISALQEDIQNTKPIISTIEKNMTEDKLLQLENAPKLIDKFKEIQKDLKDSQDILNVLRETLDEENVKNTRKLINAVPVLTKGIEQITKGSNDLDSGLEKLSGNMKKFNDNGIVKLHDKFNNKTSDIQELMDIKDEIVKCSNEYKTFTGVTKDMEGKVKFIMKTEDIKVPKIKEISKDF